MTRAPIACAASARIEPTARIVGQFAVPAGRQQIRNLVAGLVLPRNGEPRAVVRPPAATILADRNRSARGPIDNFHRSRHHRRWLIAESLAKRIAPEPGRVTVVLTGNIHSRVAIGTSFDASYRPMGYLLRAQLA